MPSPRLFDPRHDYAPLEGFLAPAMPRPELWRTVAGVVIAVAFYYGAIVGLSSYLVARLGPMTAQVVLDSVLAGSTAIGLTGLLYSFLPLALGVFLAARLLQSRGPGSLIGPLRRATHDFLWVAVPVICLSVLLLPISAASENVGRHLGLVEQLKWLPLALPGLLIQTGAEEVAFRGYLLQQLGARFRTPLAWMVLPSVLFGALHYDPEAYGSGAIAVCLWTALFGLFAADLTARTGTLGAAVGFHFATNYAALFLVGLYGSLDGLALFNLVINVRDPGAIMPYLAADLVAMIVAWLIARVMLRV
jgi:membrane protease YdiL (CAAX protease family)